MARRLKRLVSPWPRPATGSPACSRLDGGLVSGPTHAWSTTPRPTQGAEPGAEWNGVACLDATGPAGPAPQTDPLCAAAL
ncbi:MAG TPA: hypothetical protein VI542_24050, partial [Candidatus Tectomicrobia bacterium]